MAFKLRITGAAIGAMIAGCAGFGVAQAQDSNVTLRLSHNLPTNNALHYGVMEPWAKAVSEASGDSIKIDIYPAQQLGAAKDHYNMARDGIVDIAFYLVGIEPGRFPIVSGAEIPFLVSDNDKGSRALYEWYSSYMDTEMPDVKVCAMFYDGGGSIHSRKKVEVPEDLQGMKIRSPNKMAAELYRLAGGAPIQMSANDAAEAVERGVVDAVSFPWKLTTSLGADRVLKYHMDAKLYSLATALLINKSSYDALSDKQKAAIDQNCGADASEHMPRAWTEYEDEGREILKNKEGHEIVSLSPEHLELWKAMSANVRAAWEKEVAATGADGARIFDELKSKLDSYNASY
ncbi:TRAP-type C4-dicarboxylate transport system substrate-binding protein [Pseudaminobacter salicylatoxidans]|uniref:TRAP-type C4-dicarboxylate transport system substrate-binding protein n=1 Tax=Pseudaminobacter salicylatoxidans TaxID=93369 RepID=A0A316BKI5_PSESE|nr:TRAP transporter substrate-binding protein [Pseudaminobacter salicylatoxidans]PWJ73189.1 TRAP-type C4-dicarboxylate transport system substrate-binding protein [Pseudaminobacter salicylatoxidans]